MRLENRDPNETLSELQLLGEGVGVEDYVLPIVRIIEQKFQIIYHTAEYGR